MDLSALKALSLAINLAHNDPTVVKHLAEWKDYAWTHMELINCSSSTACVVPRQRWDWHRKQWVDFAFQPDGGKTIVTLTLTDDDPTDDDFVCVTAAFLDFDSNPLFVFHQNWHASPGQVVSRRFSISAPAGAASPHSVAVGSKQCRNGPGEDDDVYRKALKRLSQPPPQPL